MNIGSRSRPRREESRDLLVAGTTQDLRLQTLPVHTVIGEPDGGIQVTFARVGEAHRDDPAASFAVTSMIRWLPSPPKASLRTRRQLDRSSAIQTAPSSSDPRSSYPTATSISAPSSAGSKRPARRSACRPDSSELAGVVRLEDPVVAILREPDGAVAPVLPHAEDAPSPGNGNPLLMTWSPGRSKAPVGVTAPSRDTHQAAASRPSGPSLPPTARNLPLNGESPLITCLSGAPVLRSGPPATDHHGPPTWPPSNLGRPPRRGVHHPPRRRR